MSDSISPLPLLHHSHLLLRPDRDRRSQQTSTINRPLLRCARRVRRG